MRRSCSCGLPTLLLRAGLEKGTIDFIGHALALYDDDSYLSQPARDLVDRCKVSALCAPSPSMDCPPSILQTFTRFLRPLPRHAVSSHSATAGDFFDAPAAFSSVNQLADARSEKRPLLTDPFLRARRRPRSTPPAAPPQLYGESLARHVPAPPSAQRRSAHRISPPHAPWFSPAGHLLRILPIEREERAERRHGAAAQDADQRRRARSARRKCADATPRLRARPRRPPDRRQRAAQGGRRGRPPVARADRAGGRPGRGLGGGAGTASRPTCTRSTASASCPRPSPASPPVRAPRPHSALCGRRPRIVAAAVGAQAPGLGPGAGRQQPLRIMTTRAPIMA